MFTYIIYNSEIPYSVKIAEECLKSFDGHRGWEPLLFSGCSPETLSIFESKYKLSDKRSNIGKHDKRYASKKSCFYSHYTLWNKCIELNRHISIVEHDTECVASKSFDNVDGVLQLTTRSVLESNTYQGRTFPQDLKLLNEKGEGIFPSHSSHTIDGYKCIAGNTGYCISPEAAKILVDDCNNLGWGQNDLIMTTKLFPIYYIEPAPIKYIENKERRTSTFWKLNASD